tara:strand:- start:225 stop:497 length:273 start_codon:yes stop_codon:yes gene_type:complete
MPKTQKDYDALIKELDAIADTLKAAGKVKQYPFCLTDENQDWQNATSDGEYPRDAADIWDRMIHSAGLAAGMWAEEEGLNINKLIGRNIY